LPAVAFARLCHHTLAEGSSRMTAHSKLCQLVHGSATWLLIAVSLHFTGDCVYKPRGERSPAAVLVALLLLLGGVETNPGPPNYTSSPASAALRIAILNARSAVNKTALIHVINDHRLDLFAVTETWMKASHPPGITHGMAPAGYRVLHRHRANDEEGGGVALLYSEQLQVTAVSLASTVTGADCLVSRLRTRRGRLNIAVVYRPPTSSPKQSPSSAVNSASC